jgi:hypothetical protein
METDSRKEKSESVSSHHPAFSWKDLTVGLQYFNEMWTSLAQIGFVSLVNFANGHGLGLKG